MWGWGVEMGLEGLNGQAEAKVAGAFVLSKDTADQCCKNDLVCVCVGGGMHCEWPEWKQRAMRDVTARF